MSARENLKWLMVKEYLIGRDPVHAGCRVEPVKREVPASIH